MVCKICENDRLTLLLQAEDYMVSHELFNLFQCNNCQTIQTDPQPSTNQIGKYYASQDYISHTNKAVNPIQLIYKVVRYISLNRKKKLINQLTNNRRLLDFGAGTGHFIRTMSGAGWNTTAIEPDDKARQHIKGHTIIKSPEDLRPNDTYDIITLWHVLEHTHDPKSTLQLLKKHLAEKGSIVLALPNYNSLDATIYGKYWAAWDVPRHLFHFNVNAVEYLAKTCKMKIYKVLPMKFDSYYVSILSEKYRRGNSHVVSAIKNGWKSNNSAKNNNEYSSKIYILKNDK